MSLTDAAVVGTVILIFVAAFYCLLVTRNLIRIIIGLELLTKGVTLLLMYAGYVTGQKSLGQAFVITLIIMEVVVAVVAAGIAIGAFRHNNTLDVRKMRNLQG
jgi:multisubunit Na+/H+ antiporter MnhC subunit